MEKRRKRTLNRAGWETEPVKTEHARSNIHVLTSPWGWFTCRAGGRWWQHCGGRDDNRVYHQLEVSRPAQYEDATGWIHNGCAVRGSRIRCRGRTQSRTASSKHVYTHHLRAQQRHTAEISYESVPHNVHTLHFTNKQQLSKFDCPAEAFKIPAYSWRGIPFRDRKHSRKCPLMNSADS